MNRLQKACKNLNIKTTNTKTINIRTYKEYKNIKVKLAANKQQIRSKINIPIDLFDFSLVILVNHPNSL